MKSEQGLKTSFSWEEWQAGRAQRRKAALAVGPPTVRRRHSSSDTRLRAAFDGKRGPEWKQN